MCKISFILPAYKRPYLREAIASILAQTYDNLELIIVDDCSPENLKEIVNEFHDSRISYYRNETNIGCNDLVAAWTHALSYASGQWCIVASDDDIYDSRYLETMVRLTEKYPQVDLVHPRIAWIDSKGKWIIAGGERLEYSSQAHMAYAVGARGLPQALPDFMFRLSALRQCGGFVNFPLGIMSDDATWIKLAKNGVACSNEILFFFRKSGINISSRKDRISEKVTARLNFIDWIHSYIPCIKSTNAEDEYLLQNLERKSRCRLYNLISDRICDIPFFEWCRILKRHRKQTELFHLCICKRFPFLSWLRSKFTLRQS